MVRRSFRNGLGRLRAVWPLCLLFGLLTAACGDMLGRRYPSYRYRLTVQIETPQGLRTGSSVIEVQTIKDGALSLTGGGAGGDVVYRVNGQAVAVDLPNGKTLFALLRSDWDRDWAATVLALQVSYPTEQEVAVRAPARKWNPDLNFEMWMERVVATREVFVLPRFRRLGPDRVSAWPMFAQFRDPRDPRSIQQVDADHLPIAFGPGYAVHRITINRTDDPVTDSLLERLPKPDSKGFFNSDGKLRANTLKEYIFGIDDFSRGLPNE